MNLVFRIVLYAALALLVLFLGAHIAHALMQQLGWDIRWYAGVEAIAGYMGLPLLGCIVVLFVIRLRPKYRAANPFLPSWRQTYPVVVMIVVYIVAMFAAAGIGDPWISGMITTFTPLALGVGYLVWYIRRRRQEAAMRAANDPDNIFS